MSDPNQIPPTRPDQPAAAAPPAPRPAAGRTGSAFGRALRWLLAVIALPALVVAGGTLYIRHVRGQPSYGPAEVLTDEFTTAPRVTVEILPASRALQKERFRDFAVNGKGAIVVRAQGGLYDMAGGRRLGYRESGGNEQPQSMAFAGPLLAVAVQGGGMGFWDDGGFSPVELPGLHPEAVFGDSSGERLYIAASRGYDAPARWGLYVIREGEALQAVSGSTEPITAATGDEVSAIFAAGGGVFRAVTPGQPVLLASAPAGQMIEGLASAGGTVYFATGENVYAVGRDMVVPVVLGLGGKLHFTPGGLLVLDKKRGRVFRLAIEGRK